MSLNIDMHESAFVLLYIVRLAGQIFIDMTENHGCECEPIALWGYGLWAQRKYSNASTKYCRGFCLVKKWSSMNLVRNCRPSGPIRTIDHYFLQLFM